MKTLVTVLLFLFGVSSIAQEPYDYLNIIVKDGDSWVNIKPVPPSFNSNKHEKNLVKTVSWQEFVESEPDITQPEGFYLSMELEDWRRASSALYQTRVYIKESYIANLAATLSCRLFGDSLQNLEREKFLRLWVSLSRTIVVMHESKMTTLPDFNTRSKRAALVGELVWRLMVKSWTTCDVHVFSLHDPDGFSANLLIDAGGNIMTKIIIFPEVYYNEENFCYDLVNKSSKELKTFGLVKK